MQIVPLYASGLALAFVALSVRTLRMRRRFSIPIGDAGDQRMLRAMRVHSNFAEYVPLSLLLLYFVEGAGSPALLVHALAVCLVAGRVAHAFGVSQVKENYAYRVFGMAMTFVALIGSSAYLLFCYASRGIA